MTIALGYGAARWSLTVACAASLLLAAARPAEAQSLSIDASAARAVLEDVQKPTLSRDEAQRAAQIEGNRGLVQKMGEFVPGIAEQDFANALLAAAHGQAVTRREEAIFHFDDLRGRAAGLTKLLVAIDAPGAGLRDRVLARIRTFSPPDSDVSLSGYIIAGGIAGGFSFDRPAFYLNIAVADEPEVVEALMEHELYHAVQGALSVGTGYTASSGVTGDAAVCANQAQLFTDLYHEGSASYVEDYDLLGHAKGTTAIKMFGDHRSGVAEAGMSATLLELSVTGLEARQPVPYRAIYGLGFYGRSIIYNIGFVMARAIAEADGAQGLAAYLKKPGYAFLRRYTELPVYGKDAAHPALGANTLASVDRLEKGCPSAN